MIHELHPSAIQVRGSTFDRYSQLIEWGASVCYGRPMRDSPEDEERLCEKLSNLGHLTPFELITLVVCWPFGKTPPEMFYLKHVHSFMKDGEVAFVTSVRALMDATKEGVASAEQILGEVTQKDRPLHPIKKAIDAGCWGSSGSCSGFDKAPPEIWVGPMWGDSCPYKQEVARPIVLFTCSRTISHQLVRHRKASFLQESQRYCKYDEAVPVIQPLAFEDLGATAKQVWRSHQEDCHRTYLTLRKCGAAPQTARGCLSGDTATRIAMCASLPIWAWVFHLRCAKGADPEMRRLMVPLRERMLLEYPDLSFYESLYKTGGSSCGR